MELHLAETVQEFRGQCHKRASEGRRYVTHIILPLTGLYMLGMSAVLRADFDYKDDIGRVVDGYRHWSSASRYLSDVLSAIVHNLSGGIITDTSPFPQILALLIMAVVGCSVLISFCQTAEKKISGGICSYAATCCLALNPYFLSCLSFKFDAPFMALSVLFSVLPLLFAKDKAGKYVMISMVSVLAMCLTYQSSSGIYPVLVIFLAFTQWNKGEWELKKSLQFLVLSVLSYGAAMLIYKGVFVHAVPGYVSEEIWPLRELIPGTIYNYKTFYQFVKQDFTHTWKWLVCLVAGCYYLQTILTSKRQKGLAALLSALALFAESGMVFGVLMFMKDIQFYSRWMYGFGFWIGIMAVVLCGTPKVYVGKCCAVVLGWCFFIFTLTYGNDLSVIKDYSAARAQMIVDSLNELQLINDGNDYHISMTGYEKWPRSVRNHVNAFPVMERLLPENGSYLWNREYILDYYGLDNFIYDEGVKELDLPVWQSASFYNIRGNDNCILIEYKKN